MAFFLEMWPLAPALPESVKRYTFIYAGQAITMESQKVTIGAGLPASVAVLDRQGVILEVNETWREFGKQNGLADPDHCVGMSYLDVCRASGAPAPLVKELTDLLSGRRATLSRWSFCEVDGKACWRLMIGLYRSATNDVVVGHIDIASLLGPNSTEMLDVERPDLAFTVYAR